MAKRIEMSELERKKITDAGRKSMVKAIKPEPIAVTVEPELPEPIIPVVRWHSIDTAPRTGSKFVIWHNNEPAICYYDTNVNQWYLDGAGRIVHPTHWHPVETLTEK